MSDISRRNSRNEILSRLDREDCARLQPHLEELSLSFKQTIYEAQRPIEHVYFPEGAVISVVTPMEDGNAVETGTIGNEGFVGLAAVFGMETSSSRAFCQVAGRVVRLSADIAVRERRRGGAFAELLMRFANARMVMLEQSVACNRVHRLDQRMCRWLLVTHDRVGTDSFPLTQEFLAQMLGVRRPTVNIAVTSLQRARLIHNTRGRITILDRKALEKASCECYSRVRNEFARALGTTPTKRHPRG